MRGHSVQEPAPGELVVTALGMVSCLGLGVVPSCAAARAGISRWTELDAAGMDDAEVRPVPLMGHAIKGFTEGFVGLGRFLRLGDAALADLLRYGGVSSSDLSRAHFLLHLPDDTYGEAHFERYERPLLSPAEAEHARRKRRNEHTAHREQLARRLMPELLSLHGIRSHPEAWSFSFGGPASFVECLLKAEHLLATRTVERCVLGGIDSQVSGDILEVLQELGLLQHGANPDGFFPGEAAAFLVIERLGTARARGARWEARIGAMATARESRPRFSGHPPLGLGLFQAISAAYGHLGPLPPGQPLAIGNLNGSSYRANDFGHALVRMRGAGLPSDFRQWSTAESFGELGAATGPVAVCLGVRAFARRYARSSYALVWLTSDGDDRGAFFLRESPHGHQ